ncbi:glycosyltransferase family 61 protein [Rapidithrix thailandica]|uniref:Glycosyltransferase family 61 protein n=1 Tax=Rapidithrix thailandica TaxID=413964 RepID=A0AAW9SBC5_9BACT
MKLKLYNFLRKLPVSSTLIGPPKGCNNDLKTYIDTYNCKHPKTPHQYWNLGSGEYTVPPPENLKEASREAIVQTQIPYKNFVATLKKGRLLSMPYCVISNDDIVLYEVSDYLQVPPEKNPVFYFHKLPGVKKLKGKAVVLATLYDDNNYAHWLTEILPKLYLLEKCGMRIQDFDHILMRYFRSPFVQEHLDYLGIPNEKIRMIDDRTSAEKDYSKRENTSPYWHIQADELTVTNVIWRPEPWMPGFLQDLYLKENKGQVTPGKKLYIRRHNAKGRNLLNEAAVLDVLGRYGFEIIEAEKLSLLEKAGLFHEAEFIVAPHGAGMANIVFCQPGTCVLELRAHGHSSIIIDEFRQLCAAGGLKYSLLLNEGVGEPEEINTGANLDLKVDLTEFEETLKLFLTQCVSANQSMTR